MVKLRRVDGLRKIKKPAFKKIPRYKLVLAGLFLLGLFLVNFFFLGQVGAVFVFKKVEPWSLFQDGKFLILFQNNAEIRSAGGFIGSYAVLEINNFEIKNLTFNTNIYALDRSFAEKNFIKAPAPVAKMTKNQTWSLRDANYDADFQASAQDINYFYERETGDKIDGIVAINAGVIQDLLQLTGPIKLPDYHTVINADNFYLETQYKIEKEYFQNPENWVLNEPKTFLKDLYPLMMEKALAEKFALAKLIQKELDSKEIIFYFKDPAKEEIIKKQNWAGEIPDEKKLKDLFETNLPIDYLYINSNSYSGNKSSISLKEDIDYQISLDKANGQAQVNLTISRIHNGSNVWPDGKNTTWMRIFVPRGTTILAAKLNQQDIIKDINIGQEEDKTFWGIETGLEPGQAQILEFSYLLPKTISASNYHLLIQKQPGIAEQKLQVNSMGKILFDGLLDRDQKIF